MNFDIKKIEQGLPIYLKITEMAKTDAFCGEEFKKLFNGFYRVRQKTKKWYDAFYALFKECKDNPKTFKETVTIMFEKTGEIDASFCSKLIATLDPTKPIWDKYVLLWLGFSLNAPKPKETQEEKRNRIEHYAKIYDSIAEEYTRHLNDENILLSFAAFDKAFPQGIAVTPVKKLDFMLWSLRSERTISLLDYDKLLFDFKKVKSID